MPQTILITGATDGIGLGTARRLATEGHRLVLHGRDPAKLARVASEVAAQRDGGVAATVAADLSQLADVAGLAEQVIGVVDRLDVLINNAGVYRTAAPVTGEGLDARFAVNTIAPYLLTRGLLPCMDASGRVINLSSAAQAPVDPDALAGRVTLDDMGAYAQSKLALTMWSRHLANELGERGPAVVSVNPGSLLGTRMVKEGFGVEGSDVAIGVDILVRAALADEFATASGTYYDNDAHAFADPHPDALDAAKCSDLVREIETVAARTTLSG